MYERTAMMGYPLGMGAAKVAVTANTAVVAPKGVGSTDTVVITFGALQRALGALTSKVIFDPKEKIRRLMTIREQANGLLQGTPASHPYHEPIRQFVQRLTDQINTQSALTRKTGTGSVTTGTGTKTVTQPLVPNLPPPGATVTPVTEPLVPSLPPPNGGNVIKPPVANLPPPTTYPGGGGVVVPYVTPYTDPTKKPQSPQCITAPCPDYVWSQTAGRWILTYGASAAGGGAGTTTGSTPGGGNGNGNGNGAEVVQAGFDFGQLLKPPMVYYLAAGLALFFFSK